MPADPSFYRRERLAESYARFRPPVHQAVCARMMERVSPGSRLQTALDVGCGAGASTKALLPHVDRVVGVDPYSGMVKRGAVNVPGAYFVQGKFEALPFANASFELVATAGAINYADVKLALAETSRVLQLGGWFAAYDFSTARRLSVDSELTSRHLAFRAQYPSAPGYALDLASLPYAEHGLDFLGNDRFDVCVSMTANEYVEYILGELGVEIVIARGADENEIAEHCYQLFSPVFEGRRREVVFETDLVLAVSCQTIG
jgi:SAM-dependent methyltransferase